MKVYIGNYKKFLGPFQLAEKLMFWCKDEDRVFQLGQKLYDIKWLDNLLNKIDERRKRTVYVKVDRYDIYSLDCTLAKVITPALRAFIKSTSGSAYIDIWDVPEELRPTSEELAQIGGIGIHDSKHEARWNWVLGEMLFAFEHMSSDDTGEDYVDDEVDARIANGLVLFGKYYRALWR